MTAEAQEPTKVFISYSWGSEEHKERVLALANTLRDPWGIEADIDQYVRARPPFTPQQGWDLWMGKRIKWAEFVLIVCTEAYKRRFEGDEEPEAGRGVTWEGTIIRQNLYNDQLRNTKFIPVVFSAQDLLHVPIILNGSDKYVLEDEKSFRELCYRLRKEPLVVMPDVASVKLQAPPEPKFFSPPKPSTEPPPVRLDSTEIQDPTATSKGQEPADQPPLDTSRGYYIHAPLPQDTGSLTSLVLEMDSGTVQKNLDNLQNQGTSEGCREVGGHSTNISMVTPTPKRILCS